MMFLSDSLNMMAMPQILTFYDWLFHQNADGSGLSLKLAGILCGLFLLISHWIAFKHSEKVLKFCAEFRKSQTFTWGISLGILAYGLYLILNMDMGEFYTLRKYVAIASVAVVLVMLLKPLDSFLAVRMVGLSLLLAASPVLHAAFLQDPVTRLLLPILAYAWIIIGMFLVGSPYLWRDAIVVLQHRPQWVKWGSFAGMAYGGLLLICALLFW